LPGELDATRTKTSRISRSPLRAAEPIGPAQFDFDVL
jgi:hypothetical protein